MAYEKQEFKKGQALTADQLNHMEEGIASLEAGMLSGTEKRLLLTLLEGAAQTSDRMSAAYTRLRELWKADAEGPEKEVPVTALLLDFGTLTLHVGETAPMTAAVAPANATDKTVHWSVTPAECAAVADGTVTAMKAGTCIITAQAGTRKARCTLTVTD